MENLILHPKERTYISQDGDDGWGLKLTENKLHSWVWEFKKKFDVSSGLFFNSYKNINWHSNNVRLELIWTLALWIRYWKPEYKQYGICFTLHTIQSLLRCVIFVKVLFVSPSAGFSLPTDTQTELKVMSYMYWPKQTSFALCPMLCSNRSNLMWSNWSELLLMGFYCVGRVCVC